MPRKQVLPQSQFPYHVGARSINQEWFQIPMPEVWEIMCGQLHFIHHAFGVRIHSFVLMNNHFHLLVSTPQANLSEAMSWFMRETSRGLTRAGNRINQSYGGRYFRSVIGSPLYYMHAYKYVYLNPVKAGLVQHPWDYPFSTLHGLLGQGHIMIPLIEDTTLFGDVEGTLKWLERMPDEESWDSVGHALWRPTFWLAKRSGRANPLENNAL